jgi:hypothetical protein
MTRQEKKARKGKTPIPVLRAVSVLGGRGRDAEMLELFCFCCAPIGRSDVKGLAKADWTPAVDQPEMDLADRSG